MGAYDHLRDYEHYCEKYLKIKTKLQGLQPFKLRKYQIKYYKFRKAIKGPKRIVAVKPRQCGFTTQGGADNVHEFCTQPFVRGIAMADKAKRTQAVANIYSTFVNELPNQVRPMIALDNTEQIYLENPRKQHRHANPGLQSGVVFETANDPNAGRSESRRFAHLSEVAFYRYYYDIDEGIHNSIPLDSKTLILKESTANGRSGIGKPFYDLWTAAERRETIYQPFFVAWYEVDDYQMEVLPGFKLTADEKRIIKLCPDVTKENLAWRRFKILEYSSDQDNTVLSPEERVKQDFPLTPAEAFRFSGRPIFDVDLVELLIRKTSGNFAPDIKKKLPIDSYMIQMFYEDLKIYTPPRNGKEYFIGADVAEGLIDGDRSSVMIIDQEYQQVAEWHGSIEPDMFGHLLVSLGLFYNEALIVPEKNNMGHTTVTTIRNENYNKLFRVEEDDKVEKKSKITYGWVTTRKSKMIMLNEFNARFRDNDINIKSHMLAKEMSVISREENGNVELNGRDRVVAACLACMGRKQYMEYDYSPPKKKRLITGTVDEILEGLVEQEKGKDVDIYD